MISSKDNSLIKLCLQIKQKKYSREHSLCLVETFKVVSELYRKNMLTHILTLQEKAHFFDKFSNVKVEIISENISKLLSEAVTTDGIFAVCKIPDIKVQDYSRCLILDNIQDPSNIGAIIRSAYAFGFKTIFAINSVYPYSYKVIRSSMSYIMDIDYVETTYENLLIEKEKHNIQIITADMSGLDLETMPKIEGNIAIVIGNEGQGVSENIKQIADKSISIPMQNNVESLNASVSAGIIMYMLKKN